MGTFSSEFSESLSYANRNEKVALIVNEVSQEQSGFFSIFLIIFCCYPITAFPIFPLCPPLPITLPAPKVNSHTLDCIYIL